MTVNQEGYIFHIKLRNYAYVPHMISWKRGHAYAGGDSSLPLHINLHALGSPADWCASSVDSTRSLVGSIEQNEDLWPQAFCILCTCLLRYITNRYSVKLGCTLFRKRAGGFSQ